MNSLRSLLSCLPMKGKKQDIYTELIYDTTDGEKIAIYLEDDAIPYTDEDIPLYRDEDAAEKEKTPSTLGKEDALMPYTDGDILFSHDHIDKDLIADPVPLHVENASLFPSSPAMPFPNPAHAILPSLPNQHLFPSPFAFSTKLPNLKEIPSPEDQQVALRFVTLLVTLPSIHPTPAQLTAVLFHTVDAIGQGRENLGPAMREALDKIVPVADEVFNFPRNHPESLGGFLMIVGVGVLGEMIGGWAVGKLGFVFENLNDVEGEGEIGDGFVGEMGMGEMGEQYMGTDSARMRARVVHGEDSPQVKIKEGTVAEWWMREYAAYIPPGSVEEYLRLLDLQDDD